MLNVPESLDPESEFAPPDQKEMACAVTLTAQMSQTRSLVVQTYVARDAPIGLFHTVLDKLSKAINRQEAVLDLEAEELNLKVEKDKLRSMQEDFLRIEDDAQAEWERRGKKGPFKLGEKENAAKRTSVITIDRYKDAIAERTARIEKLKAKIANME